MLRYACTAASYPQAKNICRNGKRETALLTIYIALISRHRIPPFMDYYCYRFGLLLELLYRRRSSFRVRVPRHCPPPPYPPIPRHHHHRISTDPSLDAVYIYTMYAYPPLYVHGYRIFNKHASNLVLCVLICARVFVLARPLESS